MNQKPTRVIRAADTAATVTVYQAYAPPIADAAVRTGTFVPPSAGTAKAAWPVRIQWDPDRSLTGAQLTHRAIQIGLSGDAVRRYADE